MIALITPTGARARQFYLCSQFMRRQDYKGEVLWVIVDDAIPTTTDCVKEDFRQDWKVVKVFPKPAWHNGEITQARNLLAGMDVVKKHDVSAIFIIEDDDYYSPPYLREMMKRMGDYYLIGEQRTIYYNPVLKAWFQNENTLHSSLFQTAFSPALIPTFEAVSRKRGRYIDMHLFKREEIPAEKINLFQAGQLAVGIKGLPGRGGIGVGHRIGLRMTQDPDMSKLKELIGDDYLYYLNV